MTQNNENRMCFQNLCLKFLIGFTIISIKEIGFDWELIEGSIQSIINIY
jgi:hypothetical protein